MAQESVEVVRRILDRWASGDFRAGADELDPEVVGPAGITDYMRGFLKQWMGFTVEATGFEAIGDAVLVSAVQHGTGSSSGVRVEIPHWIVFTFRGGRLARIETILDEREALEAVGLRE
jgi:ketosteroid isomerase-like protein